MSPHFRRLRSKTGNGVLLLPLAASAYPAEALFGGA
jgi:hypothetical protein